MIRFGLYTEVEGETKLWLLDVFVYKHRSSLLRKLRVLGDEDPKQCKAMFFGRDEPCECDEYSIYGGVFFSEKHFGAGIVAHELLHATMCHPDISRRLRRGSKKRLVAIGTERQELDLQEIVAEHLGALVRGFWNTYYKYKGEEDQ